MTDLRFIFALCVIAFVSLASVTCRAADPVAARYGITLNAGETLVAVNGVPVKDAGPLVFTVRRIVTAPVRILGDTWQYMGEKRIDRVEARQCRQDARGNWQCNSGH